LARSTLSCHQRNADQKMCVSVSVMLFTSPRQI